MSCDWMVEPNQFWLSREEPCLVSCFSFFISLNINHFIRCSNTNTSKTGVIGWKLLRTGSKTEFWLITWCLQAVFALNRDVLTSKEFQKHHFPPKTNFKLLKRLESNWHKRNVKCNDLEKMSFENFIFSCLCCVKLYKPVIETLTHISIWDRVHSFRVTFKMWIMK